MADAPDDAGPGPASTDARLSYRLRTVFFGLAIAIMAGWVLHVGRPIFVPVVAAILFVFVINGLSELSQRMPVLGERVPRWGHVLLAALVISAGLFATVSLLVSVTGTLSGRAAVYQQSLLAGIQQVAGLFGVEQEPTWQTIRAEILRQSDIAGLVRMVAGLTVAYAGVLLFVILNIGFLLIEQRSFGEKIVRLAPDAASAARVRFLMADINDRVGTYLALKTLMNVLLGSISYVILWLYGVEFALLWALLIGVFNYVPYFGSAVGVSLPVAFALLQFGDVDPVVTLLLLLIVAQFLVGNVVEPQVMGSSLNLSPWVILISLTAWGSLWGIAGAVFSVPITAVLLVVFSEFQSTRPISILLSRDGRIGA